jgi:DNA-directed RNA polymerase subunit RPC12/RpoP
MQIPGYIFILVGIAVSISAYYSKLYFFIVVGAGFILWGLGKIVAMKFISSGGAKEKDWDKKAQEIRPNHIKKEQNPVHMHPTVIACPSCGLKHYSHANFCQHCGSKIKK